MFIDNQPPPPTKVFRHHLNMTEFWLKFIVSLFYLMTSIYLMPPSSASAKPTDRQDLVGLYSFEQKQWSVCIQSHSPSLSYTDMMSVTSDLIKLISFSVWQWCQQRVAGFVTVSISAFYCSKHVSPKAALMFYPRLKVLLEIWSLAWKSLTWKSRLRSGRESWTQGLAQPLTASLQSPRLP